MRIGRSQYLPSLLTFYEGYIIPMNVHMYLGALLKANQLKQVPQQYCQFYACGGSSRGIQSKYRSSIDTTLITLPGTSTSS